MVMLNFTSPWKAATSSVRAPVWTAPVTYLAESRGTAAPVWALVSDLPWTMRTPSNWAAPR